MMRNRLTDLLPLFLLFGIGACSGSSEETKRQQRDREVRTLVKSIQDHDLATATAHASAFSFPVTQYDILRDYGADGFVMPIHIAVRYGRIDMLKMLAEKRRKSESLVTFDVDARDSDGNTVIMMAYFGPAKTRDDVVRFLVAEGADVNARSANIQFTALHDAATYMNRGYAELLIGLGANVNLQDKYGRTPMHLICGKEHGITDERKAVFDVVLKAKPDLTLKDKDGLTAEQVAQKLGYKPYVDKLKEAARGAKK